jgi:hypothetical protein
MPPKLKDIKIPKGYRLVIRKGKASTALDRDISGWLGLGCMVFLLYVVTLNF